MRFGSVALVLTLSAVPATQSTPAPAIDYHQHLFSPAAAALIAGKPEAPGISARELVALPRTTGRRSRSRSFRAGFARFAEA